MNSLSKIIFIALSLFFSLAGAKSYGEDAIKYSLSPSIEKIRLAENFIITFEINQNAYSKNIKIDTKEKNTEPFEIISIKELPSKDTGNKIYEFNIIPFDIGRATFPALSWSFQNEEGKILKLKSPPIYINVAPHLKKTDKDVRDIYPPFKFSSLSNTIIIFLIICLVIAGLIYLVNKKSAPLIQKIKARKEKTPYQKALENIRRLKSSGLWEEGEQKKFYIRLSDILRIYIMDEFSITAPLMTTNTLLKHLKIENQDIDLLIKVKELLQFSDLVKFAKLEPTDEERDKGIENSKEIIQRFHAYRTEREIGKEDR
jgi:uncharacterized protein YxeA